MDKDTWLEKFTEFAAPKWPCPSCGTGTLRLVPGSFQFKHSAESARNRAARSWDRGAIEYRFLAWLTCDRRACGESVCVTGFGGVEREFPGSQAITARFQPLFVHPMPDMFTVKEEWPHEVTEPLRRAFRSFFNDPEASASHLRSTIEGLLDVLSVAREQNGHRLSLHRRLELLEPEDPRTARRLMGVKEMGNAGSHGRLVIQQLVLDGMELVEHALSNGLEGRRLDDAANRLRDTYGADN